MSEPRRSGQGCGSSRLSRPAPARSASGKLAMATGQDTTTASTPFIDPLASFAGARSTRTAGPSSGDLYPIEQGDAPSFTQVSASAEIHGLLAGVHFLDQVFPEGSDPRDIFQDDVDKSAKFLDWMLSNRSKSKPPSFSEFSQSSEAVRDTYSMLWPRNADSMSQTGPYPGDAEADQFLLTDLSEDILDDEKYCFPTEDYFSLEAPEHPVYDLGHCQTETAASTAGPQDHDPDWLSMDTCPEPEVPWLNSDGTLRWSWSWSDEYGTLEPTPGKSSARRGTSPPRNASRGNRGANNKRKNRKLLLPSESLTPSGCGPKASQWATIWSFRTDLRRLYRKLKSLTYHGDLWDRSRRPHKMYRGATDLLETGLFTFEDVRKGRVPSTLREVFAFICVSVLMWKTLKRRHVTSITDALQDLHIWSRALDDSADRDALAFLIHRLWSIQTPRSDDNIDTFALMKRMVEYVSEKKYTMQVSTRYVSNGAKRCKTSDPAPGLDGPFDSCPYTAAMSSQTNLLGHFQRHVDQTLAETASHSDIHFADFLNIPGFPSPLSPNAQYDLGSEPGPQPYVPTSYSHPEPWITNNEHTSVSATWKPPEPEPEQSAFINPELLEMPSNSAGFDAQTHTAPSTEWASGSSQHARASPNRSSSSCYLPEALLICLIGSLLFISVLEFLRYIMALGDLFSVLSGHGGATSPLAQPSGRLATAQVPSSGFVTQASTKLFDPLRAVLAGDSQCMGIIAAATLLVRVGWIRSIRAIEEYFLVVAKHLVSSKTTFLLLVKTVLFQCLTSSATMAPNHVYGQDTAARYSAEYVASRETQEEVWAEKNFSGTADPPPPLNPQTGAPEDQESPERSPSSPWYDYTSTPKDLAVDAQSELSNKPTGSERLDQRQDGNTGIAVVTCPYKDCAKSYRGSDGRINLRRHIRCAHERRDRKCPNCTLRTARRDNLRQHFLKKHPEIPMPDWLAAKGRSASYVRSPPKSEKSSRLA